MHACTPRMHFEMPWFKYVHSRCMLGVHQYVGMPYSRNRPKLSFLLESNKNRIILIIKIIIETCALHHLNLPARLIHSIQMLLLLFYSCQWGKLQCAWWNIPGKQYSDHTYLQNVFKCYLFNQPNFTISYSIAKPNYVWTF